MKKVLRPGGLTVFAVCNFAFGGFQAFGVLFSFLSLGCTLQIQGFEESVSIHYRLVSIFLQAGTAVFLILSGAGSLKVKNVTGRWFANVYVVLAVIRVLLRFLWGGKGADDFSMFTIIGLIYPLLVLVFYNAVFRDVWKPLSIGTGPPSAEAEEGEKVPQTLLIAWQGIKQVLRSPAGVVLCLTFMIVGLFTAQLLLFPIEFVGKQGERMGIEMDRETTMEQIESAIVPLLGRILKRVTNEPVEERGGAGQFLPLEEQEPPVPGEEENQPGGADAEQWAYYLVRNKPAFLSVLFLIFCLILPSIVIFSGFNQIAADTKNKGLRYILMRTNRQSIYFGKYLSSIAVTVMLLVILFISIIFYVRVKLNIYPLYTTLSWGLRALLSFTAIALPYIAISLAFSGMINSGAGALGASLGVLILLPLLARLVGAAWEPLNLIHLALPYKVSFFLFHPKAGYVALSLLGLFGYTGAYLFLGFLYFRRRDL
jgi:ABC-type transport system involved in multi-copper enzyme maturation permease subunit